MLVLNPYGGLGTYDAQALAQRRRELEEAVAERQRLEDELAELEGRKVQRRELRREVRGGPGGERPTRPGAPGYVAPPAQPAPVRRKKKLPIVPIALAAVGVFIAVRALR